MFKLVGVDLYKTSDDLGDEPDILLVDIGSNNDENFFDFDAEFELKFVVKLDFLVDPESLLYSLKNDILFYIKITYKIILLITLLIYFC